MAKQAVWALIVLGALIAGFTGGTFLSGQRDALADVQDRLATLEKQLSAKGTAQGTLKSQRIAVVKVNDLILRYQKSNPTVEEQFRQELERIQPQLEQLQQQVQQGKLSQEDAATLAFNLQQSARQKLIESLARPIQAAINQLAKAQGYDAVLKHEDVVLYYQGNVFDDITEQVWSLVQPAK